jgi:hypothetical protein
MTTTGPKKPTDPQGWLPRSLDRLATLGAEPTCAAAQADGVPCAQLGTSCDECHAFFEYRDRLRAREGPP